MLQSTVRSLSLFAVFACTVISAAGCAHAAPEQKPSDTSSTTAETTKPAPRPQLVSAAPAQKDPTADDVNGQRDLQAALDDLKKTDLFFGFNDSNLTEEARGKLSKVADLLVKYPKLKIEIEGNCDERGTEAYNLVLGQQRADVARKYLANLGVKSDQVATVSFGAEKPADPGHNEKAWQENRRDAVVPATK